MKYRFVKQVIKSLKRQYGQSLTLKNVTQVGTIDWTKGTSSNRLTESKYISKVVILPTREQTKFNYDLSFVAANKNFVYGGFYDQSQRDIIIDKDDLGTFEVNNSTMAIFNSKTYQIKEIREYEEQNALYIIIIRVKGQTNES